MKRLLISTTALSVALMQINPAALMAQTVTEDGSIIADDGSVLCLGTQEQPCDLNAVMEELKAKQAATAEAEAAAQAEALPLSFFREGVPGPLCLGHPKHCQTLFDAGFLGGAAHALCQASDPTDPAGAETSHPPRRHT